MKSCQLIIILIFFLHIKLPAQLDCHVLYARDSLANRSFHRNPFDEYEPPYLRNGLEAFYDSLKAKTIKHKLVGRILAQFVVDTSGRAQCIRAVEPRNVLLGEDVIDLIEKTEFVPARKKRKPIVSIMTLPVSFEEKRYTRRKRKNN